MESAFELNRTTEVSFISKSYVLAKPKSASLMCSSADTNRFCGFKSRWIIRWVCKKSTPVINSLANLCIKFLLCEHEHNEQWFLGCVYFLNHIPGLSSLVGLVHQLGLDNQPNLVLNAQTPKTIRADDPFQLDHGIHLITFNQTNYSNEKAPRKFWLFTYDFWPLNETYLTIFGCLKASNCFKRAISRSVDIGTPSSVKATLTL